MAEALKTGLLGSPQYGKGLCQRNNSCSRQLTARQEGPLGLTGEERRLTQVLTGGETARSVSVSGHLEHWEWGRGREEGARQA